jgi:hypothetical protein
MNRPTAQRCSIPKALRPAYRAAISQGWVVEHTGNTHLRWRPADRTRAIVFTASTPSEYRSTKNSLAKLKRSGLKL